MFNNLKKLEAADKTGVFTPYQKGLYKFTVTEVVEETEEEKEWDNTTMQMVPTGSGVMVPKWVVKSKIVPAAGGVTLDTEGKEVANALYTIFINDYSLGWNKKTNKAKPGRAFITALFGVPEDGGIPAENANDLVGKECTVFLGLKKDKKGIERNEVLDCMAIKKA